jgi:hypothetical protein
MARDPRRAALRRAGWWLAAALALPGVVLGWDRLTDAADGAVDRFTHAARLIGAVGWLLLLLAAAGLVVGLALSSRPGRAAGRWLRPRLTARPVRWTAAAALVLVLLVLVVVVLPPRFTAHRPFDKAADELKAQNDVRTTLLQALAGGVLLLGAALTWRQLGVTREGQITDRYTKAVNQLGSEHLDVRVGGIYALERIAHDSDTDRATIAEVLTTYVRGHAPWPPSLPGQYPADTPLADAAVNRLPWLEVRTPDVQAAVTVLGRGGFAAKVRFLNLEKVDLRKAWLFRAEFQKARLGGAGLQGANLIRANLQGAGLGGAQLQEADLRMAQLQDAELGYAHLEGARLGGAQLQGAKLLTASLDGARADRTTKWPDCYHPREEKVIGVDDEPEPSR